MFQQLYLYLIYINLHLNFNLPNITKKEFFSLK